MRQSNVHASPGFATAFPEDHSVLKKGLRGGIPSIASIGDNAGNPMVPQRKEILRHELRRWYGGWIVSCNGRWDVVMRDAAQRMNAVGARRHLLAAMQLARERGEVSGGYKSCDGRPP